MNKVQLNDWKPASKCSLRSITGKNFSPERTAFIGRVPKNELCNAGRHLFLVTYSCIFLAATPKHDWTTGCEDNQGAMLEIDSWVDVEISVVERKAAAE